MKYSRIIFIVLITALFLTDCSPAEVPVKFSLAEATSPSCATPEAGKIAPCKFNPTTAPAAIATQAAGAKTDVARSDNQGAITVEIKPLNLDQPGDTLVFDVSMNTHSVDLSMDLAQLAVLSTDTGKTVQAIQWDAPRGGHHVAGKLSFPAISDGKKFFDGARSITLTIKDVDAPTRIFIWQLG